MKGWCGKIIEGRTRLEILNNKNKDDEGFEIDEQNADNEEIPFS